jgi:hypothetical protein
MLVGEAHDYMSPKQYAHKVGVPAGCLIDGKVLKRKGQKRWLLVAYVKEVKP